MALRHGNAARSRPWPRSRPASAKRTASVPGTVSAQTRRLKIFAVTQRLSSRLRLLRQTQCHPLRSDLPASDGNDDVLPALVHAGHGRASRAGRQIDLGDNFARRRHAAAPLTAISHGSSRSCPKTAGFRCATRYTVAGIAQAVYVTVRASRARRPRRRISCARCARRRPIRPRASRLLPMFGG